MKHIKLIILIFILLITTSCYNYVEVNELAIIEGLSIDYYDNKYQLTTEIIDIKSENENGYLINTSSNNINESFENIKNLSSKDISLSHLEIIILSKEILLNHINEISDYFIKDNNITTNFYLTYANNPKEILNNKNNNYKINSKYIVDYLDKQKNNKYKFDYIITSIKNNKNYSIPYLYLENNIIKIDKDDFIYEK